MIYVFAREAHYIYYPSSHLRSVYFFFQQQIGFADIWTNTEILFTYIRYLMVERI